MRPQVGEVADTFLNVFTEQGVAMPDFISKIEGSLQELEESEYWLELLGESGFIPADRLSSIRKETGEPKGIFVAIAVNTKARSSRPK